MLNSFFICDAEPSDEKDNQAEEEEIELCNVDLAWARTFSANTNI
jgi:hypothetical protein